MIRKLLDPLRGKYAENEYPALKKQMESWMNEKPLQGIRILDGTPVFTNTLFKYASLLAAGADLTVGYGDQIPYDPEVIKLLKEIGIPCLKGQKGSQIFDIILDCNAAHSSMNPVYGFAELTRSGAYRFSGTEDPVIMVDDSRIKAIETCLGTGESFLRGMRHFGFHDLSGKKILVFGCGKVGRGIVFYAGSAGADVVAIDYPAAVISHIGGRLLNCSKREDVLQELSSAWCVVSATGKASALADDDFYRILNNGEQIIVNMGVEDEWGDGIPEERVLNRKQPLNFVLPEPTLMKYIAPTMALHNHAALELLSSPRIPGIRKPSPESEQLYWEITRNEGIISHELSAAGL